MRRRGLQLKLRRKLIEETKPKPKPAKPAKSAKPSSPRTAEEAPSSSSRVAMVLSDDVFYGRAIMKIPRAALLSIETAPQAELRRELTDFLFERNELEKRYNVTGEDAAHLLSLAYPLIAENRNAESIFRRWLDATRNQSLTVLELTERQQLVLQGTTVEGAYAEMLRNRQLIEQSAGNLSFFRAEAAVSRAEAAWALSVIMRHARTVHPHQDARGTRRPRMYLFPLLELLDVQLSPDPSAAIAFQEEIILTEGKREEEMVVQIARRDMPKGEEVFLWPGRLSNSETAVRHGLTFPNNPVGIGRNITEPPNWSKNPESKVRKEYDKFNCSSLDSFELRFNIRGYPMRDYVRCFRVSWFLSNGWYSPAYTSRIRELNKWPPPKRYSKDDWLAWTQADAEVNRVIMTYCKAMRQQLKDTMDGQTAEEFRKSADPIDRLVWQLRGEESKTFKECIAVAKSISV
jgi:hypothetical protein